MKKIFLFLVIFALAFGAKAQSWTPIFGKQRFASGLGIPTKDSTYFSGSADSSLIYINPKDAGLYYKYKGYHKKVGTGTVSSVGLTMPSAFSVSGSPITNNGSFIVTGAGSITQYIRGDGSLATFAGTAGTLPAGGTAGQILSKIDATNYNTQWIDNYSTQIKNEVKLGAALSAGTPVYVSSANGTNMIVSASSYDAESTSSKTFGLLETGGVLNDKVKVVTYGLIAGLNTGSANAGDPVWLGANGALLYGYSNKPYAPYHLVYIGNVTRAQSVNGEIFVNVQNGFEIDELHNVAARTPSNNDGLFYESSTSLWKNKSIATVLGYTPEQPLTFSAPLSRSVNTVSIPAATGSANGYLSSTDWTTFNGKQNAITLTTTGSSGSATFVSNTLNVPTYTLAGLGGQPQLNGTGFVKASGTTISYDNSTYALDADVVKLAGSQTVTGVKTFSGAGNTFTQNTNFQDRIYLKSLSTSTYTSVGGDVDKLLIGVIGATHSFAFSENTNYTYTFPAASGTVALTSNLSSYVPYTGATQGVNIGTNMYTGGYAVLNGSGTNQAGVLSLFKGTSRAVQGNGYTNLYAEDGKVGFNDWITGNVRTFEFSLGSLTSGTTRVYTLPDASGTIALTSGLTGFVSGSGTSGQVPLFNGTQSVTNSQIYDNGSTVSIGNSVTSPNKLVSFSTNASGFAILGSGSGGAGGVYAAVTSGTGNMFQGSTSNGGYFISDNAGNTYISGKVGIGTFSSSSYNLNVVGTGNFSNNLTASQLFAGSSTHGYLNLTAANTGGNEAGIFFAINGNKWEQYTAANDLSMNWYSYALSSVAMKINPSGNVSIANNTDAGYKLDVSGTGRFGNNVLINGLITGGNNSGGTSDYTGLIVRNLANGDYYAGIDFQSGTDGGTSSIRSYRTNSSTDYQTALTFWTKGSGAGATSPTERLRITSTGDFQFAGSNVIKTVASSGYLAMYANGGGLYFGGVASTNQMTLTSAGNLGVGTTSVSSAGGQIVSEVYASSYATLRVNGGGTVKGEITGNSASNWLYAGTITNHPFVFATNSTERMRLAASTGNLLLKTATDNGYSFQVAGSGYISGIFYAGELRIGDLYTNTYTTDASWSSSQIVVPNGVLASLGTYLVEFDWSFNGIGGAPYLSSAAGIFRTNSYVNSPGDNNEVALPTSSHVGGNYTIYMATRAAGGSTTAGLSARFSWTPAGSGGTLTVRIKRLN